MAAYKVADTAIMEIWWEAASLIPSSSEANIVTL